MVEVARLAASGPRSDCHDDFNVEANQFCREFREPFKPILSPAPLYDDVLPLDPSQLQ
jgi:hypothetical protein